MNETFWGQRVISGDDKCLTLLVQSKRWKVCYQENARVYTPGSKAFSSFQKQRLRWARNSWRSDFKALFSGWAWQKPFFIFHLIDRLFQPFTTLIAPIYCLFCIYQQRWLTIAILVSWWMLSRIVKIWPHMKGNFSNIRILPWYLFVSYWFAIVRIYALFYHESARMDHPVEPQSDGAGWPVARVARLSCHRGNGRHDRRLSEFSTRENHR